MNQTLPVIDCHTHLMWYPDHLSETYAEEALTTKLVKLKRSGGLAYSANLNKHCYDAKPEDHWKVCSGLSKVVVFGLQAKACGIWIPNEVVAEYAAAHPDKIEGWASVDPTEPSCVEQLDHAVKTLHLKGLKLGPVYQHFDPQDRQYWPLFRKAQEHNLPIMWHQGATFPSAARLKWSRPLQLEDIAMDFPDLRMIIAHLGHPWESEVMVLIRKCPNIYTDISAVHYRPWRYWQALVTAMEYGVENKLLPGSDFPSATLDNVIMGLRNVNQVVEGTPLPKIPAEVQDLILYENWKPFFPHWLASQPIEEPVAVPAVPVP